MEANEDGLGDSLTVFGMFRRRMLIRGQSGARNALSRKDAFAVMQASVERERSAAQHAVSVEEKASDGTAGISVFGCGSLSSLWRAWLSALQYGKTF